MIQYIQRSLLYWTYSKICINWRLLTNLYYPKPQHIKIINLNDFIPGDLKSLKMISTGVFKKEKVNRFSESLFWIFNKSNCNQENVCRGVILCMYMNSQQLLLLRELICIKYLKKNALWIFKFRQDSDYITCTSSIVFLF